MKFTISILAFALAASCTPTGYIVDVSQYEQAITANPLSVVVKPEHVQPISAGFQPNFEVTVGTDIGSISVGPNGVGGEVVIDARSGK